LNYQIPLSEKQGDAPESFRQLIPDTVKHDAPGLHFNDTSFRSGWQQ